MEAEGRHSLARFPSDYRLVRHAGVPGHDLPCDLQSVRHQVGARLVAPEPMAFPDDVLVDVAALDRLDVWQLGHVYLELYGLDRSPHTLHHRL